MTYPYRFAPGVEVSGAIMSAIFNHYRRDDVLASLQAHGLDYFDPDQWYAVDQFINLLAEWSHMPAFSTNLVSVGMAMIYHIDLPDAIERLSDFDKMLKLGDLHIAQHRNGDVGSYTVKAVSPRMISYRQNTVWPDDLIYGYIYGAAQRYIGHTSFFTLRYAENHQRQDMGGKSTILELTLE